MMRASGTLFMGNTPPLASTAADGVFALTLLAFDRIGAHQIEPWRITWTGQDAQAFWQDHGAALTYDQPLHVNLRRVRIFVNGKRGGGAEFMADVVQAYLPPLAGHIGTKADPQLYAKTECSAHVVGVIRY